MTYVSRTPHLPEAVPDVAVQMGFQRPLGGESYGPLRVVGGEYGLGVMRWPAGPTTAPVHLHDLDVSGVHANPPRSSNGTAEAGLWVGNNAIIERCKVHDCAWMGMWVGASCEWLVASDLDIDVRMNPSAVGVYLEHSCEYVRIRRSRIRAAGNGINLEWWYEGTGPRRLILEDCTIVSDEAWCVFVDAGVYGCEFRRCTLVGPNGIAHPLHLADTSQPNLLEWETLDTTRVTGPREWQHDHPMGARSA
jgi:hypothetical protein